MHNRVKFVIEEWDGDLNKYHAIHVAGCSHQVIDPDPVGAASTWRELLDNLLQRSEEFETVEHVQQYAAPCARKALPVPVVASAAPVERPRVSMASTIQALAEPARYVLAGAASCGETITYGALVELLSEQYPQFEQPRPLLVNWVGQLLYGVTELNKAHGEPLLASLVIRAKDGQVGDGYAEAARMRYGVEVTLADEHARVERQKCYRVFGG